MFKRLAVVSLRVGVLLTCGCTARDYRTVYEEVSPDHKAIAKIVLYGPYRNADQRLKFEIVSGSVATTVYKDDSADVAPCFEEIYWSPDSFTVGFLTHNCYGGELILGFDRKVGRTIEKAQVADGLRSKLRAKYGPVIRSVEKPSRPIDPLEWAFSEEARDAFFSRYGAR